jgi:hypothetical protein
MADGEAERLPVVLELAVAEATVSHKHEWDSG